MKKVLALAFIAAVLLLGCSADGFFPSENNTSDDIDWGKLCKRADGSCVDVPSAKACTNGILVPRSECD